MTEKRVARKRAPARVGGRGKLDETARVHPYRTVEERVARGLAWREVVAVEGQATYGINRRRKNRWGSCEPRMTRG